MKERPILFSGEMVRAILEGRKTQTRRVVKPELPNKPTEISGKSWGNVNGGFYYCGVKCPFGRQGDRLWVRETWAGNQGDIRYRANRDSLHNFKKWSPSIHMPKWACRLVLEIVSVRVERLNDITEGDAQQEGVLLSVQTEAVKHFAPHLPPIIWRDYEDQGAYCETAKTSFKTLWQSINGPDTWAANPWVWVIEFKRVTL